jgi:hypothetical protein
LDISINLAKNVTVVDFSFSGTGNGYYILDSSGIIHAAGDATPIDVPSIVGRAIGLETGIVGGSIENLPDDIGPIPTATNTQAPKPTATHTAVPQATATNTPTLIAVPTSTPGGLGDPTATSTAVPATNTPVASAPTNTPVPPTNTPLPGETPTSTPTIPPTPTVAPETATPTPTVTPVPPTPTQAGPVDEIVPPGVSTLMLGTWAGTAKTSTQTRNARVTISVQSGKVVIRDELGTIFGSVSNINMAVVNPYNLTHQEPPLSTTIRTFTVSNAKDLGEPNFISGLYGEIDISNPFTPVQKVSISLELFRQ